MGTLYTLYKADKPEKYELGKGEWFRIGKNEELVIFQMNALWSKVALGRFIRKALTWPLGGITIRESEATAQDILDWCGDDRIVMVPDTFSHIESLRDLGVTQRRHRQTGSRWSIYKDGVMPAELNARELAESHKLLEERRREEAEMWQKEFERMGLTQPSVESR